MTLTNLIEVYVRNPVHRNNFHRSTILEFKSQITSDLIIDLIMFGMVLYF
jgi:hypothetical protein